MEDSQRLKTPTSQTDGGIGNGRISQYSSLLNSCLRLLSIRFRSKSEIIRHLQKKTHDQELINKVITNLENSQLIDDKKFTSWAVESLSSRKFLGHKIIKQKLKAKGVPEELINKAISSSANEDESAYQALDKKMRSFAGLSFRDFRNKAGRYLYSKGFSWEVIERTIKKRYNQHDVS